MGPHMVEEEVDILSNNKVNMVSSNNHNNLSNSNNRIPTVINSKAKEDNKVPLILLNMACNLLHRRDKANIPQILNLQATEEEEEVEL